MDVHTHWVESIRMEAKTVTAEESHSGESYDVITITVISERGGMETITCFGGHGRKVRLDLGEVIQ